MTVTINEMTLEDLEQIKDDLNTEFDDFWTISVLKEELQTSNSHYFVAKTSLRRNCWF